MILAIVLGLVFAAIFGRIIFPAISAMFYVLALPAYFIIRFILAFAWALMRKLKTKPKARPEPIPNNVVSFEKEKGKREKKSP